MIRRPFPMMLRTLWKEPERYLRSYFSQVPGCYFTNDAAIRDAVQELIWPVTTSTITTVVVFLPLGLLTGVEGQFFHALSIVLTIAVLVSLLLAISIIPLLAEEFITPADVRESREDEMRHPRGFRGVLARIGEGIDTLSVKYERTLGSVLHHSRRMVVAAGALAA